MADNEKQWVCVVCGYVYDGDTPFEELPDDWTCPVCGVDKSFFALPAAGGKRKAAPRTADDRNGCRPDGF